MTTGQIKAAAFVDEMAKLAIPSLQRIGELMEGYPHETGAAITGLLGAADLAKHGPWGKGGRSRGEAKASRTVQGLEQQDQTDPQVQERLRDALSKQRNAASGAERAGSLLGAAGLEGASIYASNKLLAPSIFKADRGSVTTLDELIALHSDLTKQMGHAVPITTMPEGRFWHALSIPKGGFQPGFMRKREARKYEPVFYKNRVEMAKEKLDQLKETNPELYVDWTSKGDPINYEALAAQSKRDAVQALETGYVMAPMKAGPHFSAHEFGHALFGNSTIGKLTHAARVPAALAGIAGGMTAASVADPDSTTSKLSPLMAAGGVAPVLGEEAMASINAIRSMKRTGFSPQQLSMAKKQLGKAFGTYGMVLGLPAIAAPYLIRKFKQYNQSRREEQGLPSVGQLQQRIQSLPKTKTAKPRWIRNLLSLSPEAQSRLISASAKIREVKPLGHGGERISDLVVHPTHGISVRKVPLLGDLDLRHIGQVEQYANNQIGMEERIKELAKGEGSFAHILGKGPRGEAYYQFAQGAPADEDALTNWLQHKRKLDQAKNDYITVLLSGKARPGTLARLHARRMDADKSVMDASIALNKGPEIPADANPILNQIKEEYPGMHDLRGANVVGGKIVDLSPEMRMIRHYEGTTPKSSVGFSRQHYLSTPGLNDSTSQLVPRPKTRGFF